MSLNLAVSIDDFFDPSTLIYNLAFVLNIDVSRIRIVEIVAEDTPVRGGRSLLQSSESSHTTITLEFGDPPVMNISTPEAPSVAEEVAMAGADDDSVDIMVCMYVCICVYVCVFMYKYNYIFVCICVRMYVNYFNFCCIQDHTVSMTNTSVDTNPLNEDPPEDALDFAEQFNVSAVEYTESVQLYEEMLAEVEEVNEVAETLVNLVRIASSIFIIAVC